MAASGALYAFGLEPLWLSTETLDVHLARLDPVFDGYTVVQLSDLHTGDGVPREHLARAVAVANGFAPDLLVVTGDVIDDASDRAAPEMAAEILSAAQAKDGVFAVTGNHDTGSYHDGSRPDFEAVARLRGALAVGGVQLLDNQAAVIERGRARLRVAGFGDLWSGCFEPRAFRAPADCTLALSHNPDTAPELAERGADLVLSGHTHGGQILVPILGPPWIPLKHKQYLRGHFHIGDSQLYVNRGLGWTHRIRFRARPEITVLRLRPQEVPRRRAIPRRRAVPG